METTPDKLIDSQLQHWIDRQEYAGQEASNKISIKESITELDSILEKEEKPEQVSIYDLPEVIDEE